MGVAPIRRTRDGRWFWGFYQEFGFDVHMQRATGAPVLLTTDHPAIKTGSQGVRLRILGDSLPAKLTAADLDLGSGVTVKSIVSQSPGELIAQVDVAADAVSGKRDVALPGARCCKARLPSYDRVDYIKVIPEIFDGAGWGGERRPKGYQQLDAVGLPSRGATESLTPRTMWSSARWT